MGHYSNKVENQPLAHSNTFNYIPKGGDLFKWCDEEYWCIESRNYSGVVSPVDETFYIRNFIWNYGREKQIFIREATERELENLGL